MQTYIYNYASLSSFTWLSPTSNLLTIQLKGRNEHG
jgi:hypothetical protein